MRLRRGYVLALTLLIGAFPSGCSKTDLRFASPAATFKTYQKALATRDLDLLWSCYSDTYKASLAPDRDAWIRAWEQKSDAQIAAELRREIAEEQTINDRIGYLLFDATTLESKQASPFFYFMRDQGSWKITTHLDSVFHRELERAINRGEFKLPDR